MLEALVGHSAAYSQTLEAGRQFCETATDPEHQTRLQTEVQDLEKAWDETQARLRGRCELLNTGVQVRFGINWEKRLTSSSSRIIQSVTTCTSHICFSFLILTESLK